MTSYDIPNLVTVSTTSNTCVMIRAYPIIFPGPSKRLELYSLPFWTTGHSISSRYPVAICTDWMTILIPSKSFRDHLTYRGIEIHMPNLGKSFATPGLHPEVSREAFEKPKAMALSCDPS